MTAANESDDDQDGLKRLIEYARREASDQRHEVAAFFLDLAARSLVRVESGIEPRDLSAHWAS